MLSFWSTPFTFIGTARIFRHVIRLKYTWSKAMRKGTNYFDRFWCHVSQANSKQTFNSGSSEGKMYMLKSKYKWAHTNMAEFAESTIWI